jgi:hypothetical protein
MRVPDVRSLMIHLLSDKTSNLPATMWACNCKGGGVVFRMVAIEPSTKANLSLRMMMGTGVKLLWRETPRANNWDGCNRVLAIHHF